MAQGFPRTSAVNAARYRFAVRPRDLPCQQDHLPARRHARRGQSRAERHYQDLLDCGRDFHATDAGRLDLWNELPQGHGRARMGMGLSLCIDTDGARCRLADRLLQMEEVAVSAGSLDFNPIMNIVLSSGSSRASSRGVLVVEQDAAPAGVLRKARTRAAPGLRLVANKGRPPGAG